MYDPLGDPLFLHSQYNHGLVSQGKDNVFKEK